MPGIPDAKFGLADLDGTVDEGNLLDDAVNDLNAALIALGAGTISFDIVNIVNGTAARLRLGDTGATSGRRNYEVATDNGVTALRARSDDQSTIVQTFISLDHATGGVTIPDGKLLNDGEAWHVVGSGGSEPAFQNSWTSDASPLSFYKHLGRVYLRGQAKRSGGSFATIFTLPAGYRPAQEQRQVIPIGASYDTPDVLLIATSGAVSIPAGPGNGQLDGISFRAEA